MASTDPRRSRRLRGLVPEEPPLQQVCFICQGNIDIGSLARCQRTACCHVWMHRTCHHQMVTRVRTCGHCRRENAEFTGVVLETDEEEENDDQGTERVRLELNEYRMERRDLHTHRVGSYLWSRFPYEFELYVRQPCVAIWYLYYTLLEDFVAQFQNRPLYVHGRVMLPVPVTSGVRCLVYRFFVFNTPFSVYDMIQIQRFMTFFVFQPFRGKNGGHWPWRVSGDTETKDDLSRRTIL